MSAGLEVFNGGNMDDSISAIRAGSQSLCLGSLSRRTEILILAGRGHRERLWAVDSIVCNLPHEMRFTEQIRSLELFSLALKILLSACRLTTLGQAIYALRIRWCHTRKSLFHRARMFLRFSFGTPPIATETSNVKLRGSPASGRVPLECRVRRVYTTRSTNRRTK